MPISILFECNINLRSQLYFSTNKNIMQLKFYFGLAHSSAGNLLNNRFCYYVKAQHYEKVL